MTVLHLRDVAPSPRPTTRVVRRLAGLAFGLLLAAPALAAEWVGLAHPVADLQLSVPVGGVVQRISTRPGQQVRAGDVLLALDSAAQQAELRRRTVLLEDESELQAARARLQALTELMGMTETVARGSQSVSREELLKLRLEKTSAEGRLQQLEVQKKRERIEHEQARIDLEQRTLRAPMAGVVVDVRAEIGEWARPGDEVVRLADISQVEVRLNLPQAVAAGLRVGARVPAAFEAGAAQVQSTGTVRYVSSLADSASGLVDVRIRFANPKGQIRAGAKAVIRDLPTS